MLILVLCPGAPPPPWMLTPAIFPVKERTKSGSVWAKIEAEISVKINGAIAFKDFFITGCSAVCILDCR